jgi:hypothetical protein
VNQDQFILLAFKVAEVASVVTILVFTACYSRWAAWWSNPIGRTLVYEGLAIVLVLIPSLLSIFINFNRLTSHIAAWYDVASFGAVPVIMVWRTFVFWKIHKAGKLTRNGNENGGS